MTNEKGLLYDWNSIYLSEVIDTIETGCRPKGGITNLKEGIPSIGGEHLNSYGKFDLKNIRLIPHKFFESMRTGKIRKYDILLVKDGATTGKVSFIDDSFPFKKAAVNEHVFILRGKNKKIDQKYLYYNIFSPRGQNNIKKSFHGAAIGGITRKFIDQYTLKLPPLETQKKIVSVLDKVEILKDMRIKTNESTNDYLNSIFFEMFGNPIINNKGWEELTLAKICIKITDGTHNSPPLVDSGIPYVTAKHIKPNHIDFYSNPTYISAPYHKKIYNRCNPKKGDVLYIKDGATTGIAAINNFPFEFSMLSSLALLRPDYNKITSEYLCYWLNNPLVREKMTNSMSGAAIKRFTLIKIKQFKILVPPISLQNKFTNIVREIEKIKEYQGRSKQQIDSLFDCLLQKAFQGELYC